MRYIRETPGSAVLALHLFDDPLRVGLNQVGEMQRPKLKLVATGDTVDKNSEGAKAAA